MKSLVPFQRSTPVLYWNKDAFKEAGLDPNTPPATWDEMVSFGKKLTKTDAAGNPTEKQTFAFPLKLNRVQLQWDGEQEMRWKRAAATSAS